MHDPLFAPAGAMCAVHPDQPARRTCARCGNFMCPQCSVNGEERHCPSCRALGGGDAFPFSRTDFDFSRVWDYAFDRWKVEWVMLAISVLIVGGLGMVGGVVSNVINQLGVQIAGRNAGLLAVFLVGGVLASQLLNAIIQGIGTMGLVRITVDVLQGRKADVNRMFSQLKKLGRYVVMILLLAVMVGVPLLICFGAVVGAAFVVSGAALSDGMRAFDHLGPAPVLVLLGGSSVVLLGSLYFLLPLNFVAWELVYGDCEPLEAIKRCYRLADGYRLQIFGYSFVGGLVTLVGLLVCCVGVLPAAALRELLMGGLYLSLRKGTELPPPTEP